MENLRLESALDRATDDRRPILVDFPPRQQGIAAALRRAFAVTQTAPAADEFDQLLAKIH